MEQSVGNMQSVAVIHCLKMCGVVFFFVQDPVRVVDAHFSAGIDAILAFPEFDEPGASLIVEINRKGVKDHVKTERCLVEQGSVPRLALPGIVEGGYDILFWLINVSKRCKDRIQETAFLFEGEGADLLYGRIPAPDSEEKAEQQ